MDLGTQACAGDSVDALKMDCVGTGWDRVAEGYSNLLFAETGGWLKDRAIPIKMIIPNPTSHLQEDFKIELLPNIIPDV